MNRIILNETSYFGAGCRSVIAVEAARRGFKKAFFVTDKDLIKFGVAAEIIKVFDENQIPYELYSDVKANPTIANVQNGVAAYKASGADFIVALGGGSSIDTAKGIGIVVNNPDFADVKSLEGVADTKHKAVPTFALPTTAGTAAEVTINYVIIDEDARKKMVCVDPNDIPAVAIVDPELMYSMPKGLTTENIVVSEGIEHIVYKREKTKNVKNMKPLIIPVTPALKDILEWFKQNTSLVGNYLLPIITKDYDGEQLYDHIRTRYQRLNNNLKKLGKILGIEKNLTTYVSRHTMAMTLQGNDVSRETISAVLGHRDIKTTMTYLDSLSQNVLDRVAMLL